MKEKQLTKPINGRQSKAALLFAFRFATLLQKQSPLLPAGYGRR